MNRRGIVDIGLTFFVFIVIVLILGFFIFLTTAVNVFKDPANPGEVSSTELSSSFLLESIKVMSGETGKKELLLDGIVYSKILRREVALTQEKISSTGLSLTEKNSLLKERDLLLSKIQNIRQGIKQKMVEKSNESERALCLIIITEPVWKGKLLNVENIYLKAEKGVVREAGSPRDADEILNYKEEGDLAAIRAFQVTYSENISLVFDLEYYYGECENE